MNLPSITPSSSGSLLYAVGNPRWNITACGASWVCGGSGIQGSTGYGLGGTATEYITSASGTTAINFTQNQSGTWSALVMSFKITALQAAAPMPTFSPAGGSYTSAQSVTLSDAISGAAIYYTTNGATPTTASTLYTGPISVTQTTTIKAIAVASSFANSPMGTATYTINFPGGSADRLQSCRRELHQRAIGHSQRCDFRGGHLLHDQRGYPDHLLHALYRSNLRHPDHHDQSHRGRQWLRQQPCGDSSLHH